ERGQGSEGNPGFWGKQQFDHCLKLVVRLGNFYRRRRCNLSPPRHLQKLWINQNPISSRFDGFFAQPTSR
ncbi:MAG: hypothetical protein RBR56_04930, partial [Halothiobacillus sp.]|nr:hypothetical protein [Halothiobacillus sp.]